MEYRVLEPYINLETSEGVISLYKGQVINLSKEVAIRLLEEGKIAPIEKVAYKVWSEILQAYLWVVDTDEDMHSLRSQGVEEAIYTLDECRKLKGMNKEDLKGIHKVKEVFGDSKVEEVKPKRSNDYVERN